MSISLIHAVNTALHEAGLLRKRIDAEWDHISQMAVNAWHTKVEQPTTAINAPTALNQLPTDLAEKVQAIMNRTAADAGDVASVEVAADANESGVDKDDDVENTLGEPAVQAEPEAETDTTTELLSGANGERLSASIEEFKNGETVERGLIDPAKTEDGGEQSSEQSSEVSQDAPVEGADKQEKSEDESASGDKEEAADEEAK